MSIEASDEVEMRGKAGFGQHPPGIAANRKHAPGLDHVVLVETEHSLFSHNAPAIYDRLAIIFAIRLEPGQFEEAIGGRIKADSIEFPGNLGAADPQGTILYKAWIVKSGPFGVCQKIAPIERPR